MTISTSLLRRTVFMAGCLGLLMGCTRAGEDSPKSTQTTLPESSNQPGNDDANRAFNEYVAKQREDRIRGVPPPPSQFPLPNVYGEPLHPRPNHVNFYRINDHYPNYLLCEYAVYEKSYNQADEPKWLETALEQIRRFGPAKFPPIKWIAVAVRNVAEHKDASTFEQSFKVGTIFQASDVFDSSHSLSQVVAKAVMDRHPFKLDRQRSEFFPDEQQRWMIVERHVATNSPPASSKQTNRPLQQ